MDFVRDDDGDDDDDDGGDGGISIRVGVWRRAWGGLSALTGVMESFGGRGDARRVEDAVLEDGGGVPVRMEGRKEWAMESFSRLARLESAPLVEIIVLDDGDGVPVCMAGEMISRRGCSALVIVRTDVYAPWAEDGLLLNGGSECRAR